MFMDKQYSPEEFNLYNSAYVGVVLYQAIREYQSKNESGIHCGLLYLIAPMSLSIRYSSILPATTMSPIAAWSADNEGALIGLAEVVFSYADVVNSAVVFLLEHDAILLDDEGRYRLKSYSLPSKPAYVIKNVKFKDSFLTAGFLGRWFAAASSVESIYAQLGVRP